MASFKNSTIYLFFAMVLFVPIEARSVETYKQTGIVDRLTFFGSGGLGSAETVIYVINPTVSSARCGPIPVIADQSFRVGAPANSSQELRHFEHLNAQLLDAYLRRVPVTLTYVCGLNNPEVLGVD